MKKTLEIRSKGAIGRKIMPRTSDFKCTSCSFEQELLFKDSDDLTVNKDHIVCPKCNSKMDMLFGMPGVIIGETNDEISAKPSRYWKNAEENRIKRQRKEQDAQREKIRYKDKETIQKIKNHRQNTARFNEE
jgi:predicted nucleic acid-binding Zn ribbon protein